ncbi:BolA family protein [Pseudomonadota bacterium]
MSNNRIESIRQTLQQALSPTQLEVIDDSHMHAGHAGAGSKGHFTVRICSAAFEGKSPIQRHRLVYSALEDLMETDIHALSIQASTT